MIGFLAIRARSRLSEKFLLSGSWFVEDRPKGLRMSRLFSSCMQIEASLSESGTCGSSIAEAWKSLLCFKSLPRDTGAPVPDMRGGRYPICSSLVIYWRGASYTMLLTRELLLPSIERKASLWALGVHHTRCNSCCELSCYDVSVGIPFPAQLCFLRSPLWWEEGAGERGLHPSCLE